MCHMLIVTPIRFSLTPGKPIFDQVVFAAIRAFVSGQMRPGDAFPSVRALAADLKIHPNTAHKVVQHLIHERWLEVTPGVGTVVAAHPDARTGDRQKLLQDQVEELIVEAKRVGIGLDELGREITTRWQAMDRPGGDKEPS